MWKPPLIINLTELELPLEVGADTYWIGLHPSEFTGCQLFGK